ncbi:MAG: rubrerythrin family protein [Desulfobulbaceae bacterium]|nr:rubrerythrin family protein [Desulfobulbaceae bacterium]
MVQLIGSQTEKNILTAFAGESQARNRYTYFAKQAKKEGLVQVSQIFERTADQEKEHAKRLFKFLQGGEVEVVASFPSGVIGNTLQNLEAAAAGENYEYSEMYPEFANIAMKEGFDDIASAFTSIAVAEKQHEKQYRDFIDNLASGRVFKRDDSVVWYCANCGYLHEGTDAPEKCPACDHARAYFQLLGENW